ncbi:hypothetical protein BO94DRAFT_574895 [Aspergillus sclerotioniger CBS 115572]|uniref:Uncharacterized protein n=1 Tax=Aspergillus sclerotioniger CBS 115572 TaxID=1450535 RepID=A0A317WQW7_9EURO|nr:hypothetical protein BO94DRAFT_574895 [Aspergillus sclerotioniger CBS 115572]PWY88904.1 hypothetical protein BO94DRAFT_574895 [Aspergillus sclerotioniger CBS 115572]
MNFLLLLFLGLLQLVSAARSGTYNAGWAVGDTTWKQTDSVFERETGIAKYRLFQADGWIYKYQLDIEVSQVQGPIGGTYVFYDSTGDEYNLMVFIAGFHTIDFNSDDPYIQMVKVVEG